MDTTDTLLMAMATMERDLLMPSPLLKPMPNPGGMETMDTTDTLPMAMATMERDLLILIRVKKVDTRNDELHQAKQSWTMTKQKNSAERNQYHYIGSLNCYIGYLVSPIDKK